jgi:hypothetical protein
VTDGAWTGLTIIALALLAMCATIAIVHLQREPAAADDIADAYDAADEYDAAAEEYDAVECDAVECDTEAGPYSDDSRQSRR